MILFLKSFILFVMLIFFFCRVELLVLVRDVCEFYRLKLFEVLKNYENLRIREIMKSDIM